MRRQAENLIGMGIVLAWMVALPLYVLLVWRFGR